MREQKKSIWYYIGSICPTFVRIPDRETEIPKHKEVLCWNELCMVIDLDLKNNNLSVVKKTIFGLVTARLNNWGSLNTKRYCVVGVAKKVIDSDC